MPRDFDLISFGAGGLNEFLSPSLTIIEQPTTSLGRAAFDVTLEQIRSGDDFKPVTFSCRRCSSWARHASARAVVQGSPSMRTLGPVSNERIENGLSPREVCPSKGRASSHTKRHPPGSCPVNPALD